MLPLRANPVSRVLLRSLCAALSIIYLRLRSPATSSGLPPDIGRATLDCRYTWPCNPSDVLPGRIATPAVGSYPTFSPLPASRFAESRSQPRSGVVTFAGGSFLLRCYTLTDVKPLTWTAPCAARTFLPRSRTCPHLPAAARSALTAAMERTRTAKILFFSRAANFRPTRAAAKAEPRTEYATARRTAKPLNRTRRATADKPPTNRRRTAEPNTPQPAEPPPNHR